MVYSKAELEILWATVNPGNGDPHLMAAIALAESAGKSNALNSIGACGFWQIHPYERGCLNPVTNTRIAGEKLRSQGLGAWESYTNGSYKQFYTGATANTKNADFELIPGELSIPGLGAVGEAGQETGEALGKPGTEALKKLGLPSSIGEIGSVFHFLTSKEGWIRIGKVLIGLLLLLSGVLGMANVSASVIPIPV